MPDDPVEQQIAEIIQSRLTAENPDSGWAVAWVGLKIAAQLKAMEQKLAALDYALLGNSTMDHNTIAQRLGSIASAIDKSEISR
jgi:hypothetical protein